MKESLRKEATLAYQRINHQWLKFHYHVLLLCVAISSIFEVVMYMIIKLTGTMYDSNWQYWLKYIIAPIGVGCIIALLCFYVIKHKTIKVRVKYYMVSILMMMIASNLSFFHSGYQAILFAFLIPILMTIMYENQRLTSLITLCTIPLEIITALNTSLDPYKEISHGYLINLLILIILTIVTWMISYYMIRFSLLKKEVVIQQDVERQFLKEKILVDELTNVGTKNAFMQNLQALVGTNCDFHLVMIDIDDFKKINDQFGHLYGDDVLRCLGLSLIQMRPQCSCYRYGGDEFCVIIHDNDKAHVWQDITTLQHDFTSLLQTSNKLIKIHVTISVGISKYHPSMQATDVIKCADDALYESKNLSKNTITYKA